MTRLLYASVLLASVALAGCGSDSEPSTAPPPAASAPAAATPMALDTTDAAADTTDFFDRAEAEAAEAAAGHTHDDGTTHSH